MRRVALIVAICGGIGACGAANGQGAISGTTGADKLASTTLCADSYALALAPERAVALSWQAGTPLSTVSADDPRPRIDADAETLFGRSDTVLTGPGGPNPRGAVTIAWGEDFGAVLHNIEALERVLDVDGSGLRADLDSLSALPRPARAPRILYLSRGGGSAGAGTYVDAAIRAAGGVNAAQGTGWHTPSVEAVLQLDPDIVLTSFFGSDYHGANDRAVRHGALRRFIEGRPRIDVPGKLWPCAGPGLIEATQLINAGIMAWDGA